LRKREERLSEVFLEEEFILKYCPLENQSSG
jgi:hypothetical protein